MQLIRETIEYVEQLQVGSLSFSYNMTTNGMLLDRYMDFLVEKNFTLLISLDGNAYHSGYRVDKGGHGSFERVTKNVQMLKDKYPDFFDKQVNFNAVLHDRNSVSECFRAIHELFGKTPRVSELNTNGIVPEKVDEFYRMFTSKMESFETAWVEPELMEAFKEEDSHSIVYHSMLMNYVGNRYATYMDLFDPGYEEHYLPTGTCRPFERKLFLTVHGKILPCEKIGQEHVLGYLKDGNLELDPEAVARYYGSLYKKVLENCLHCSLKRSCGRCLFLLKEKNGKLICPGILTREKQKKEFNDFLTYSENNPGDYEKLLSTIAID